MPYAKLSGQNQKNIDACHTRKPMIPYNATATDSVDEDKKEKKLN